MRFLQIILLHFLKLNWCPWWNSIPFSPLKSVEGEKWLLWRSRDLTWSWSNIRSRDFACASVDKRFYTPRFVLSPLSLCFFSLLFRLARLTRTSKLNWRQNVTLWRKLLTSDTRASRWHEYRALMLEKKLIPEKIQKSERVLLWP